MAYLAEDLYKKWGPVLDHEDQGKITDSQRRLVTATVLENTQRELRASEAMIRGSQSLMESVPANALSAEGGSNIDTFDPVLMI